MSNFNVDERRKKIEKVAEEVFEKIGNPVSVLQVSAVIESLGYRHSDCPSEFGKKDIFDLSQDVYAICKKKARNQKHRIREKESWYVPFWSFIKHYFSGIALGLPIAGQIAFIAFTGYSLWAWIKFTELQATLVAFGTILSFIVTGGFTQVMGREVTYYLSIGNKATAREIALKLFNFGTLIVLGVGICFFLLNLIFEVFPFRFIHIILLYYFFLAELWLSTAMIYSAKRKLSVFVNLSIGTMVVISLNKSLKLDIHTSHIIGLAVSNILMYLWARFIFRIREKKIGYVSIKAKRPSVLAYVNTPFFKFGFYYFLLLFIDRVVSWSAFSSSRFYFFWFRTPYELGVDWALLSFGFTLAVLEYSVNDFSERLIGIQKKFYAYRLKSYNLWYHNFYFARVAFLFLFGFASILAVYLGVIYLGEKFQHIKEVREFFESPVTFKVYYFASVSYLLLAFGLMNNLYFFTLWKANYGLKAIKVAVLVDFVVGLFASRLISWEYGIIGFLVGSLTFAVLTSFYMMRFLKIFDYQYYSAF